jgi:hypothetical protein
MAAVPVLAGIASTAIFASSTMPMLGKALRTRELGSYSLGNLALANLGNAVHSLYVFSLAPGPLWALHAFNLASTAFMLFWYLRFELNPRRRRSSRAARSLEVSGRAAQGLGRRGLLR